MGSFFIGRPVFAAVISVVVALIGALSYFVLPTARFPDISLPNISISAPYPGGNVETLARSVATPLENRINSSPGMIYLQSSSTNDGQMSINATFKVGYNLDAATADVLTRVAHGPDLRGRVVGAASRIAGAASGGRGRVGVSTAVV